MATLAADHYDEIRSRMQQIASEEQPRCPVNGISLYACLRSSARCGDHCPHKDDWIGPAPE